jgi:hypothetical protein
LVALQQTHAITWIIQRCCIDFYLLKRINRARESFCDRKHSPTVVAAY